MTLQKFSYHPQINHVSAVVRCFHVTFGQFQRKLGVSIRKFQHRPGLAENRGHRVVRKDAAMELISVFVSALFFCVVSAGVLLDDIHWTYTGRLFRNDQRIEKKKV